jgi:hypothetical protein
MRVASLALLLAGCASPAPTDPRLVEAAGKYAAYGRVDDRARWAPAACAAPVEEPPRLSASRDAETHGRKLYYLFARNREAYRIFRELPQPVGQVLVKESWHPADASPTKNPKTGEKGPLFLMLKTGEPDSDEGWIYATATPDGKSITASGKIASCMECHQSERAKDRLFGHPSCASSK